MYMHVSQEDTKCWYHSRLSLFWKFKMFCGSNHRSDAKIVFTLKVHGDEVFESRFHDGMFRRLLFWVQKVRHLWYASYHGIFHIIYRGMFFINFFLPWSNLSRCLYISYRACDTYIIVLFSHKLVELCFSITFFPEQKVIAEFVGELSPLLWVCYHPKGWRSRL